MPILDEEESDGTTAMTGQPIPDEQDAPTAMALEVAEEGEQLRHANGAAATREIPTQAAAGGVGAQRAQRAEGAPAERLDDERGLGARRPRGPDGGTLGEPAFVLKDNPGLQACSVFFTWGQRCLSQRWVTTGSCSLARRAGRWRLHPI